ncbi:migration and invasion enhancer 1-like isoform X2 [Anarhichas minor]|uniref:migration and invasion enhancer 1-like isoform X2 n=1 Tax=Anarhichas minor TaxID=65739 RepID=UPI003F7388E1
MPLCCSHVDLLYLILFPFLLRCDQFRLTGVSVQTAFLLPTCSFEIELNGQLIFSKLELGGFPKEDDVLAEIQNSHDGKPVTKITKSRAPCVIM